MSVYFPREQRGNKTSIILLRITFIVPSDLKSNIGVQGIHDRETVRYAHRLSADPFGSARRLLFRVTRSSDSEEPLCVVDGVSACVLLPQSARSVGSWGHLSRIDMHSLVSSPLLTTNSLIYFGPASRCLSFFGRTAANPLSIIWIRSY